MRKWREQLQDGGFDFGAAGIPLLDLGFGDDILFFAAAARMVDALVTCLEGVGVALNAPKTWILPTQAQPGKTVSTQHGLELEVLELIKARN